jgi:TIR domain
MDSKGEKTRQAKSRIFISYRRRETAGHAGRLYDELVEHFGSERVFMDVAMEPGVDFADQINEAVGASGALIAMIGATWTTVTDERGVRRLDDPNDVHRMEIEAALSGGTLVIPALVQGAHMPSEDELPEELRPLLRRQAVELSEARWQYDVDRLVTVIERAIAREAGRGRPAPLTRLIGGIRSRIRRLNARRPLQAGFVAGVLSTLVVVAVLLAATGYFSPARLEITEFRYQQPPPGESIAPRCGVVVESDYRVVRARFVVDGNERNVLEEQTRDPWQCNNTGNRNRWDTCEGHSREFRLDDSKPHTLTATVEDSQGNTESETIQVRTRCPRG